MYSMHLFDSNKKSKPEEVEVKTLSQEGEMKAAQTSGIGGREKYMPKMGKGLTIR